VGTIEISARLRFKVWNVKVAFQHLPCPVTALIRANQRTEIDVISRLFTEESVVRDLGHTYIGLEIRKWIEAKIIKGAIEFYPIHVVELNGDITVTAMMTYAETWSEKRKTSQVDCYFKVDGDKVSFLDITKRKIQDLPRVIENFVFAMNTFNSNAFMQTFLDDALVNDQQNDYRGKSNITEWADRDIIGEKVTMYVTSSHQQYSNLTITANVTGNYDKRGLPDPIELSFYFSVIQNRIAQLIILNNSKDLMIR
jgi:hypothetical protein